MNNILRHIYAVFLKFRSVKGFDPLKEFKGKRIAVIGAADTALSSEWGVLINNLDLVIRVNKAPHSWNPDMEKNIGKKTDILYHSFFENLESGGGAIDQDLYSKFGIKKIVNPNNNSLGQKAHLNFYKRHKKPIQTFILDQDISERITNEFEEGLPTIGFYALASVLMTQAEEIYISGFSFFKTPYYKGYRDHLLDEKRNKEHIKKQGLHDPDREFEVFKKLLRNSPAKKIILDPYLRNILSA
ncbi:glycosyltransferase family 29 protein [Christiangramia salexigens]|uniref:DUF115 domain-containing protein n=1 Tax=Christiangramia salexigens TaxID=1913577 RepID=A0A1L3J2E9_9FLAO|nr:glycosyltransferase family 29 protein [Christiangramia salexigens]APG59288.1 hypothetical protein LPB144_02170 [Christiangramia salexigens]